MQWHLYTSAIYASKCSGTKAIRMWLLYDFSLFYNTSKFLLVSLLANILRRNPCPGHKDHSNITAGIPIFQYNSRDPKISTQQQGYYLHKINHPKHMGFLCSSTTRMIWPKSIVVISNLVQSVMSKTHFEETEGGIFSRLARSIWRRRLLLDYYILVGFRLRVKLAHRQVCLFYNGSYLVRFLLVDQRFFFLRNTFFFGHRLCYGKGF